MQGTPPTEITPPEAVPDSGISAWRSLFVCNELQLGFAKLLEFLGKEAFVTSIPDINTSTQADGCLVESE